MFCTEAVPIPNTDTPTPRCRHWLRRLPRGRWLAAALGLSALLTSLVLWEMESSWLQARWFAGWARELSYAVQPGTNTAIRFPVDGPFDERLGYTRLPVFTERLQASGYSVVAQAQPSEALTRYLDRGFFAPFREKSQAGLQLQDCRRETLFQARVPQPVYASAEAVPPLVAQTLAFIENREILSTDEPHHNPAVEWGRLGRAVIDQAKVLASGDHPAAGGSTLATQIEKFRHSPDGRTAGPLDKYRQMVSASVRAYMDGENTVAARQRILLDYLNSLPLGALRGHGDVNGIGDGLGAWYGARLEDASQLLRQPQDQAEGLAARGLAYRQTLSLLIAQRRPSWYFGAGQPQLNQLIDSYLRLLGETGVLAPALRDAALQATLVVATRYRDPDEASTEVDERKGASLLRVQLAALLDVPSLYDLDRLDLSARSTLDGPAQSAVTRTLNRLREPALAKAAGLLDAQLLQRGDPAKLLYSFTLYERGEGVNRVRLQTDNLDQPFDINSGAKLELGSTAKLRTLVTYLELVAGLHARLAPLDRKALLALSVSPKDRLSRWAVDHLAQATDRSLAAMLEAAMQRRYSASPAEAFFTGGGSHSFANFKPEDNAKTPTLYEALRDSVNLVFIRLMRDIVRHHMHRDPTSAASMLDNPEHPGREPMLNRFADREGSQFIRGFYRKYRGQNAEQITETLLTSVRPTPLRLAVVFRALNPRADASAFAAFVAEQLNGPVPPRAVLDRVFAQQAPGRYSLNDQGYLAHVHPLELLVAAHLRAHPGASVGEVIAASAADRLAVYSWLFKTKARSAQDIRIQSLLELDAFVEIHRSWQRLGYPFASLVPSYASAIGSSGDRPAALAELMGILVNQGVRQPTVYLEDLRFAQNTPYETRWTRPTGLPERVLPAEVAAIAQKALARVVDEGTARRLRGAITGRDGQALAIGGKTGTGDNRLNTYGAGGARTGSKAINRTATFVFFIGDRHFGTLTAYVPGEAADAYRFTSALPVQILKHMVPLLKPVLAAATPEGCAGGEVALKWAPDLQATATAARLAPKN